ADEKNPEKIVEEYVKSVKDVAGQLKVNNVVVYPFAHLSKELSSVEIAVKVLNNCAEQLKKDFKVWQAPFGWYKKFNIVNKGHPLAELSRELSVGDDLGDIHVTDTYKKLIELLDNNKTEYRLIDHKPEGRTEIVSPMRGNKLSEAAKCIVVMIKGKDTKYVLAVFPGDSKVDLNTVKDLFGATYASFATPEIAEKLSGSVSGTILPFSFNPKLELIVDPKLLENDYIYFNAARLDRSMALKTKDYVKLAKPRLEKITQIAGEPKKESTGKIILDRRNLPANDHRILGQDLKLFHLADEIGAGLPLWMPNGETLRHLLMDFMRKTEEKYGYKYVSTPHIAKGSMYHATGHLPYYKDSMYPPIDIDGQEYYLKPMNCPHHHMIFKQLVQSYKDLPLRLAEPGMTYRSELSGVTYGLIRVRGFLQNDSHIYVTPKQLKQEFIKVLELFKEVYKRMGVKDYWFRLSLPDFKKNPDKFTGDPKEWEHACEEIRKAMKEFGQKFVESEGEASFYGPKIDVQIKNSQGKEETIATSQVDIVVPKRLGLTYTNENNQKAGDLIVIHRAILGSYERFIAYLLEQTEGKLPLWLSPVQVKVLSFTDRNVRTTEKMTQELLENGIRAEPDLKDHTVEHKVRDAELQKINYIIVIGDKEEEKGMLAVRTRGSKKVEFGVKKEAFIEKLRKEIEEKK
ncbi:MAG TPA: threonine--tRNA ligase, partial [archaeon]|nr:threonine--tRNA ligase [archaeon]